MLSTFQKIRAFLSSRAPAAVHPSLLVDKDGRALGPELAATVTTLLIDVALCDDCFPESELTEIMSILRNELGISDEAAQEAVSVALENDHDTGSVIEKIRCISGTLTDEQKEFLLALTLKVAAADDRLAAAEADLINKTAGVLGLNQEQVESARLRAQRS